MLSAQLLHATVLGSCEKAGRRDAAPHGCAWSNRKEKQCRGEGCNNKKKTSVVAVIHSQGSQLSRNHGNVSHWWDFFICHLQGQSSRSRWNGWHSRNATLKGREGGREGESGLTECTEKTKKAEWLSVFVGGLLMKKKIPGHISF